MRGSDFLVGEGIGFSAEAVGEGTGGSSAASAPSDSSECSSSELASTWDSLAVVNVLLFSSIGSTSEGGWSSVADFGVVGATSSIGSAAMSFAAISAYDALASFVS